jgi:uroporphyrinogen decarboxylase
MTSLKGTNDYRHMLAVLNNQRPQRLPLYEHIISPLIMERILNVRFADLLNGDARDKAAFFQHYCAFFQQTTYDTVSYEVGLADLLPDHGAILGGRPGPIQSRADFERYPWDELPAIYWHTAQPLFDALVQALPPNMKALGGVGYGVFEVSEDLVGYEHLAYMQADDPDLFAELYVKIGDTMTAIWRTFLDRYSEHFAICRMGDDMGFKTGTLIAPKVIRQHIIPQYRRLIAQIRQAGKPFLWHSCGKIFEIMDDVIALGINAKHSNEDQIAPFDVWIERYGERIGLLGGIDVDVLCQKTPAEISAEVFEKGSRFRSKAKGYALGSGNSIPDYVPVDGYLAMVDAAQRIRAAEITQN